jgi:hypothetical protein
MYTQTCRDRASKNTENALQNAHEDNHSGKAMEVLLMKAKRQGVEFCNELSLLPTLDEVSKHVARMTGPQGPRRVRTTITDSRGHGDSTFFLGNGTRMRLDDSDTKPAMNAVGFFLYTQCRGNTGDRWPDIMGAAS